MNALKGTIIFASGVAVGLGIGWIFCRKKMAEKDEAMDELRKYYLEKHLDVKKDIQTKIDKANEDVAISKIAAYSHIIDRMEADRNKSPESAAFSDEVVVKEEKEMAEAESPEEEQSSEPYLITEDEFINDKNDYEKLSLTYFTIDDTLADDCDEIVDVEETISTDIFNQISESEDGDYYVRNNTLQTDYEIMKVDQSYKERYGFEY